MSIQGLGFHIQVVQWQLTHQVKVVMKLLIVSLNLLNGNIYLLDIGGFNAGYSEHTLSKLVEVAKKHKVNKILLNKTLVRECLKHY